MTPVQPPTADRYWVRNDVGRAWGPFGLEALARLNLGRFDPARISVSTDGKEFRPLSEFPLVLQQLQKAAAATPVAPKRPAVTAEPPPPPPPPKPRVIAAPVVEDPAPPPSGTLETHSVVNLYARAASMQLTGQLSIDTGEGISAIWFKKGTPESVTLPRGAEVLANYLQDKGVLASVNAEQAVAACGGPDGDLINVLIPLGFVPPHELFPLLGEFGVAALGKVLGYERGQFTWSAGVTPPPGSFALGDRWSLLSQWGRSLGAGIVRRRLGDRMHRAVYPAGSARATNDQLKMTAQEVRVMPLFDGTRSPEQAAREVVGESEVVFRLAFLLGEIGNLSFGPELKRISATVEAVAPALEKVSVGDEKATAAPTDASTLGKVAVKSVGVKVEAPRPPIAPPPPTPAAKPIAPPAPPPAAAKPIAPPPPAAPKAPAPAAKPIAPPPPRPPSAPRPVPVMTQATHSTVPAAAPVKPAPKEDLAALEAMLEKWKKATHFEVLGLDKKANTETVKAAYFVLARQHHPDTVSASNDGKLKKLKEDLTARINAAYQAIGDDASRQKYLAELAEGDKIDIGPIMQAEEDFLRATIMVKARKFVEALELIDRAIALNPKEPEFFAWRAYARFVNAQNKRAEYPTAIAECQRVLKESPMCVAAALFMGNMSKIIGENDKAIAAFRKVLEIEPGHIDATRELRMAGKA